MAQIDPNDLANYARIAQTARPVNYETKKFLDDDVFLEMLQRHPEFAELYPMLAAIHSTTYLPEDEKIGVNAWYSRIAKIRGICLILECYLDESDLQAWEFLEALEEWAKTQTYDSRRGFKATILTEQKLTINAPPKPAEKKGFLGGLLG